MSRHLFTLVGLLLLGVVVFGYGIQAISAGPGAERAAHQAAMWAVIATCHVFGLSTRRDT